MRVERSNVVMEPLFKTVGRSGTPQNGPDLQRLVSQQFRGLSPVRFPAKKRAASGPTATRLDVKFEDRKEFLLLLGRIAQMVPIVYTVHDCRDPKDNKFLEVAVNGEADAAALNGRRLEPHGVLVQGA